MITDAGNALEYDTVVEFGRTKRDTSRILADTGLHAVGMLEVQAATNYPQAGTGCSLELHGHYLGYTDDPGFRPRATAKRLCGRNVLSNWLGAPTITIKPISSVGQLMDWCRYISKPPLKGHYLQPDNRKDSGYTRQSTDVTPSAALRLAEVLGHFTMLDLASATGKGGLALKRAWRADLQAWHHRHRNVVPVDAPALIQQVWASDRTSMKRLPVQIRWNAQSPQSEHWRTAMAAHFEKVAGHRAAIGDIAPE
ncbi:MAG: hypothetical protein EOO77_37990 [Oxalobacteraceae bacterium]|nr:MAG: hypothetical protein EOO77_37990 [Oxalobacteraceae bacterium]